MHSPLVPSRVESKPIAATANHIEVPPGHVYVVPVVNGEEQEKGFFTTEKMVKKVYSDPTKFVVKKKGNK